MTREKSSSIWRAFLTPVLLTNACKTSLVVGTLFNIINQGTSILAGRQEWAHLSLNYLVPFSVALYSSVVTLRSHHDPDR